MVSRKRRQCQRRAIGLSEQALRLMCFGERESPPSPFARVLTTTEKLAQRALVFSRTSSMRCSITSAGKRAASSGRHAPEKRPRPSPGGQITLLAWSAAEQYHDRKNFIPLEERLHLRRHAKEAKATH